MCSPFATLKSSFSKGGEGGVAFTGGRSSIQNGSWQTPSCRQTRPDIAYAVSAVSSGQQHPTKRHWVALKKVYRYLAGTPDRGLLFHGGCEPVIGAWCDADFGSDAVDSKSRTGYIITIGGTPVDWFSKKQDIVALSTAEAEYVAIECPRLAKLSSSCATWWNS